MRARLARVARALARARARALAALAAVVALALWVRMGPLPDGLLDEAAGPSTLVVDRHGTPLYEALAGDDARRMRIAADHLPPLVVAATVAVEDRRFWRHPGVDPLALARALRVNLAEGRIVEGGSTLTQQVAKHLLARRGPTARRTVLAKIREAVVALRLEHRFTKRELLAMYLNLAPYGNQVAGIERASREYFGVPAAMVTPAQAAFLAGLPQRPSGFNPYRRKAAAMARQRTVLHRMEREGLISAEEARQARADAVVFSRAATRPLAPHFVQMVVAAAGDHPPERLQTTLDADLQADVAGVIEHQRDQLRAHGADNVAVVVLDNATGEWLAWEGSGDYVDRAHGGAINGPVTPRQPGSALKPFTYALAFESGFGPASVLADVPASFPTAEPGVVYSPRNYDGRYRGPMLARFALAGSENVPAVVLASELGVPALLRFLGRAGFSTFDKTAAYYGLGVTLGNAEVRLDELVAAYAAFARGGAWLPPTAVPRPLEGTSPFRQIVSPRTAFWITDILSDADAREFAFGRGGSLELPFPVAVKTGTSQSYRDNWTVGYSTHVTVGVWVGNFDRTALRNSSGVTGAAPIFHAVMLAAERRVAGESFSTAPVARPPGTVVERTVCALSGQTANAWCPLRRREFVAAESPDVACRWHHGTDGGVVTEWPSEYRQWAREHAGTSPESTLAARERGRDRDSRAGPTRRASRASGAAAGSAVPERLAIASPPDGATYLIDPTLRREFQTLPLRAVAARGLVEWRVSGAVVGRAPADGEVAWPLAPGTHTIEARDGRGQVSEATVVVR
ncbi:MAG: penicillin-binding protein 1C [Vicinamibacterales bacterium]